LTDCPVFHQPIQSAYGKQLFVGLLYAIQNSDAKQISALWNKLFVYLCVHQCIKQSSETTHALIEKTMTFIASNYQNPITVRDMANYNCMSVYHYCRIFKALTDISPHQFLMQYRLSMSHKYLQANQSVFDAAIDSGFYDSSHFIRTFYQQMAVSPKSYQQSIVKKSKNIQ
jgi:AraC-like DNA-binding protein